MNGALALFAVLGGLGGLGGLGAFFYAFATKRKLDAEARKLNTDADVALSGSALQWLAVTRQEVRDCRAEIGGLRAHVSDVLEPMMREQGMTVPRFQWPPPEEGAS